MNNFALSNEIEERGITIIWGLADELADEKVGCPVNKPVGGMGERPKYNWVSSINTLLKKPSKFPEGVFVVIPMDRMDLKSGKYILLNYLEKVKTPVQTLKKWWGKYNKMRQKHIQN